MLDCAISPSSKRVPAVAVSATVDSWEETATAFKSVLSEVYSKLGNRGTVFTSKLYNATIIMCHCVYTSLAKLPITFGPISNLFLCFVHVLQILYKFSLCPGDDNNVSGLM